MSSCNETLLGRLLPNTKRLRQLIKQFGNIWIIHDANDGPVPMQCFNGKPGWKITSENGKHFRNVEIKDIKISG